MPSWATDTRFSQRFVIKAVILIILLVWPIQYAFVELLHEPWPALMMPRMAKWGGKITYNRLASVVEIVAHTGSGGRITVLQEDLLRGLPRSHHERVLHYQFRPDQGISRWELLAPTRKKKKFPLNLYFEPRLRGPQGNSSPTRDWLLARLSERYPDQEFHKVEFIWSRVPLSLNEIGRAVESEEVGRFVVELDELDEQPIR